MFVSIEEKVKQIISKQFTIPLVDILNCKDFRKDFKANTLDIIELIIFLEEEFKIEILDDEIPIFVNVKSTISFIKDNINREPLPQKEDDITISNNIIPKKNLNIDFNIKNIN